MKRRVVAGMCRIGVEAALVDAARRRLINTRTPFADIEDILARDLTLRQKAGLVLFGEAGRAGDVLTHLNRVTGSRDAGDLLKGLDEKTHEGSSTPEDTIAGATRLVDVFAAVAG